MEDEATPTTGKGEASRGGQPVPIVHVAGSHHEMGKQIGATQREAVHRMIASYRRMFEDEGNRLAITDWDEAILHARKYLPFAEESVPQYVDELQGIADGAEADFTDLLVLNCAEALTSDMLHIGCTSLAAAPEVTAERALLIGHNEDWLPDDIENVYLVHARPDGEPAFLAITYGGLLPNIGFNECGIAQCCDSVYPDDARIGVPRIFVSRAVLAACTPAEAIGACVNRRRAAGYNHLIVHESGEMYNVEVSAEDFEVIYGIDGMLVHTNHYLSPRMQTVEKNSFDLIDSRVRYNRANRLLRSRPGRLVEADFRAILSDHVNHPQSICNHINPAQDPLDQGQTIASLLINLSSRKMQVAWGPPCQADYHSYQLES